MKNRQEIVDEKFQQMRENYYRNQQIIHQQELEIRERIKRRQKPKSRVNFDNILPRVKERNMGMNL